MRASAGSRIQLLLTLDQTHWRRHDRGFWAQVLAQAVSEAAPEVLRVDSYEMRDRDITMKLRGRLPVRQMRRLLDEHEAFLRLRSRLVDLGAEAAFVVEEEGT